MSTGSREAADFLRIANALIEAATPERGESGQ
jgi:hypothetical protein